MIICFESLNPTKKKIIDDNINIEDVPSQPNGNSELLAPKSWIICKPLENAFEQAFKIASINPKKTVRYIIKHFYSELEANFLDIYLCFTSTYSL